ncbi:MAG: lactate 2-monooxygenase [Imperialibacter sp.]|uniref:lactate 2-monooxygenase n=1 Tax=Imperialibacter sp. TaxID=2038411 RepID=UPI0032EC330E
MSEPMDALSWQKKIYLDGMAGILPKVPVDFAKLQKKAKKNMSKEAWAYIAGGAGRETTMAENHSGFEKWKVVPRMLNDVSQRDTSTTLFEKKLPVPLLLSPVGVLEMVHKKADLAVGKAAAKAGVPFIFSNQASVPMEKVAAAMGDSPRWFQLYWSKSNELVESLVKRAENCGCSAIVVTLDTSMLGWRTRDLDLAFLPFLQGKGIAQYTSDPVFMRLLKEKAIGEETPVERKIRPTTFLSLIQLLNNYPGGFFRNAFSGEPLAAVRQFINIYSRPSLTWKDLEFLRKRTKLPILLKGILHPDDAKMAMEHGMDGIILSNHGGRQVDGAVSTIEMLPEVKKAVGNDFPILLDSGVRSGADMMKALALGASAVCIARSYAFGLAIAGEQGVYDVIRNMAADFELNMGLAGCKNIEEVKALKLRG